MRLLRTLFWLAVVAVLAAFTVANWQPVEVHIWQGLVLDTKLPALVIAAFLIGLMPAWLVYRATRWRLNKRIANLEAQLHARAAPSLTATSLDAASVQAGETTP